MDWLQHAAQEDPHAPALVTRDRRWTYRELDAAANAAAAALVRSGVVPGDRVAFSGERSEAAVIAAWGIPRAGATGLALDPSLPPAEAMRRTREAGARAVWSPLGEGWRARGRGFEPPAAGPPDPAARYALFTSGSAGPARAVLLTGSTIAASAAASQARLGNGREDAWLAILPFHHVGGLSILWRSARSGAAVVMEASFDPARSAALLRSGTVTMASVVPRMLHRILEADPGPYQGLRAVLVGGGPVDPDLLRRARAAGIPALETYGTTETSSQITTVVAARAEEHPGSAGPPLDGIDVRVVDGQGRPRPPGSAGRIQVRGPVVSPGFLDGEEIPPGWFTTGDLGVLDGEGWLQVVGRADEVIVSGGEKVAPRRVEEVLGLHPGVVDVRLSGEDDVTWGRAVVAEVVLADGVESADVEVWARRRLAPYEVPKRWRVVPKIDRGWKH